MRCPNCDFVEIVSTEVGDNGLTEFDCEGCGFRWLSDVTDLAEISEAVVKYRADEELRARAEHEAAVTCPAEHRRNLQYACQDCVDAWVLRNVPQVGTR